MLKFGRKFYQNYFRSINRWQFKKIIFIVLCIFAICGILKNCTLSTKFRQPEVAPRVDGGYNVTNAYFVNTAGCRMPYFEANNSQIWKYLHSAIIVKCKKPLTRTSDVGNTLWRTMTDEDLREHYNLGNVGNIICYYTELQRKTDLVNIMRPNWTSFRLEFNESLEIPKEIEFISVACRTLNGEIFYKDYHFFAVNKSVDVTKTSNNLEVITQSMFSNNEQPKSTNDIYFEKSMDLDKEQNLNLTSSVGVSSSTSDAGVYSVPELNPSYPISLQSSTLSTISKPQSSGSTPKTFAQAERLSLMILGIDGVSHLNFLRHMPQTADHIHKHLEHVELWGFNKIADNSYPNLMPVLSGLSADELKQTCLEGEAKGRYDNCPFLWKQYKKAGYMTAYLEDMGSLSLFNHHHKGFVNPPTDYYLRPIALQMERKVSYNFTRNMHLCVGGRRTVDLVLEMLRKLVPYFKTQDFFSFCWMVSFSHDIIDLPKLIDNDFVQLFELLETSGVLNKTVVFLMSDHGIRMGAFRHTYQGMIEERLPLFMAIFPKWFKQQYPLAIANMIKNKHRLTTFHDVHETALDLLNMSSLHASELRQRTIDLHEADKMPRGISLFLPVPKTRTCEMAGIASHWCTCYERKYIRTNDARVQTAASYVVEVINARLRDYPQCKKLYLDVVQESSIATPHHNLVADMVDQYSIDVTLRMQTKPGNAIFEATVRLSAHKKKLTGTISRINLYGPQSYCVDNYLVKMFCYCQN